MRKKITQELSSIEEKTSKDESVTINNLVLSWNCYNQKSKEFASRMLETNSFLCGSMYVPLAFNDFEYKNMLFFAALVGVDEKLSKDFACQEQAIIDKNITYQEYSYDLFYYESSQVLNDEISAIFNSSKSSDEINSYILSTCSRLDDIEIDAIKQLHENYDLYLFSFTDYGESFISYNNALSTIEKKHVGDYKLLTNIYENRQKMFLAEILSLLYMIKSQQEQ